MHRVELDTQRVAVISDWGRGDKGHLVFRATSNLVSDALTTQIGVVNLGFTASQALKDEIYNNAVFPAQGSRPLFSSIHALLSAPVVASALWLFNVRAQPKTFRCGDFWHGPLRCSCRQWVRRSRGRQSGCAANLSHVTPGSCARWPPG